MTALTDEEFAGYSYVITSEPNKLGETLICTIYNSNNEEVVSARGSYANYSGYGYTKAGIIESCKAQLRELIKNNFQEPVQEPYDTDFLNRLANEDYITDYGELKNGELVIMFDTWTQVEGEDEREYVEGQGMVKTGRYIKSVYAKLRELAEKNLLKPSINRTIKEVEFVFTDRYVKCDNCGTIYDREWDTIPYIESADMGLCSNCINEDSDVVAGMIEEAKEDFSKALPVEIDDKVIEDLGYVRITDKQDFSTRYSEHGELNWGAYNIPLNQVKAICTMFNGFAKLTSVWQFEDEYTLYFPADLVQEAREELGIEEEE